MRKDQRVACWSCGQYKPYDIKDRGMFWRVSISGMATLPVLDTQGRCEDCWS